MNDIQNQQKMSNNKYRELILSANYLGPNVRPSIIGIMDIERRAKRTAGYATEHDDGHVFLQLPSTVSTAVGSVRPSPRGRAACAVTAPHRGRRQLTHDETMVNLNHMPATVEPCARLRASVEQL
jgi:hypothetical protein